MTTVAIIPARKGSKRIKNKNITLFNGKPMIYWTIKAAKKSKIFKKIYVDTDCKKIKKISIKFGAEVPKIREKKFSGDKVSVNQSTYNFLNVLEKNCDFKIENVVQLMPNCPFRNSRDIKFAYNKFLKNKKISLISHVKFKFANPWWAVIKKKNNIFRIFNNAYKKNSQDLPELVCPSGAIWISNLKNFLKSKNFYGKNYSIYLLDWKNGIDIDTKEELNLSKDIIKLKR